METQDGMNETDRKRLAFVEQLVRLNGAMAQLFDKGDLALFTEMNLAIKEMYRLQHGSEDDAFLTIAPDCEVIYDNFNMIVAVLRTTENGVIDAGAQKAINKFLHNIDGAAVNIASLFGIV